ncbi:MAG TPA: hypothetical protein VI504_16585 [Candidatus Eisenbacteria bacterium]
MRSHRFPAMPLRALALVAALALPAPGLAATLTGVVKDEGGVAVGNVDIDFIDQCSGDNVFLASDHTAADGTFSITIAAGTYDVHFIPPPGSPLAAGEHTDLIVSANASLGTVTLHPGRLVSGTVLTPGLAAAANVDLKFVNVATDHHTFMSKTLTDLSGHYAIRVPPGTWSVDFRPAAGTTFGDAVRPSLVVGATDISGLSDVLTNGFTLIGNIRTKSGNLKIKNADVSFFDKCTGLKLATSHDNSDVNGNFSVVVPAGDYTFTLDPPACAGVEATRIGTLLVSGSADLGTFALGPAIVVSGIVLAPNGLPLVDAKFKFYDATVLGSPRQGATRDHTDANGHFSIQVPPGTYDINIDPPPGVNALVYHLAAISTGAGNIDLGTLHTTAGLAISGHLQGPGSVPMANVNINVLDHTTRASQRIANDNTDASGNFTVYVSPGVYDLHYDTPACDGMAAGQRDSVIVSASMSLAALALQPGVHVVGHVTDPAALAVAGADLDVFAAGSAVKRYTPGAQTDAAGAYDLFLPTGTYDLHYVPPSTSRSRPAQSLGVPVPGAETLPTTVLANGWLVSGTVRDGGTLVPLAGVTLEFYPGGHFPVLWTPHHVTGTLGTYDVSVDPGTYDIRFVPPVGSGYAEQWLHQVAVGADLPLADMLLSPPSAGVGPGAGASLSLAAPSPNPARRHVSLTFAAPEGEAELTAWDIAGRRVATLWRGRSAAPVTVQWNGARDGGSLLPSGVYLVRLVDSRGASRTRRVTLFQ